MHLNGAMEATVSISNSISFIIQTNIDTPQATGAQKRRSLGFIHLAANLVELSKYLI